MEIQETLFDDLPTIEIGDRLHIYRKTDDEVDLYCSIRKVNIDDMGVCHLEFEVSNGAWDGTLNFVTNEVYVHFTKESYIAHRVELIVSEEGRRTWRKINRLADRVDPWEVSF